MPTSIPQRPPTWPGYEVDTDRLRLYVRRSGNPKGEKLVLLHGWAVHGGMYQWQRKLLEDRFDLIVPDLRGHGLSDAPRSGYSAEDLAEDIRSLLDAMDLEQVHLAGYSLGGFVAIAMAQAHPERIRRLALLCTAARQGDRMQRAGLRALEHVFRVAPPQAMGEISRRLLAGPGIPDEMSRILLWLMRHNSRSGLRGGARMLRRANLEASLRQIPHPTLVVTAARDTAIRRQDSQFLIDCIPNTVHRHFEDAGHGLAASHPEELSRCLLEFLSPEEKS